MAEETMRAFEFNGKRRGIRLDQGTWQAVDWLAEQRGVKWAELAREWATLGGRGLYKDDNLTRIIRSAAMNSLLMETVFAERAEHYSAPQATGLRLVNTFYEDADFDEALALDGVSIEAEIDFESFQILSGINEFGKVTLYIRNMLKGAPHVAITIPLTPEQWEKAEGAA